MYKECKFARNKNGITLLSLAIMIVVLLILGSIGVNYSANSIKLARLTKFTTEFEIIGTQVSIARQNREYNNSYENYGLDESDTRINEINELLDNKLVNVFNIPESNLELSKKRFKFYSEQNIKENFDIDGIEQEFLINIQDNIIISFDGIKYKGKLYNTMEELEEDGIANNSYKIKYHKYANPYIPKNFYYVGGTWDTGYVISDSEEDKYVSNQSRDLNGDIMASCKGNLYVWVPVVEKDSTYTWGVDWATVTSETDYTNIELALNEYRVTYKNSNFVDEWYYNELYYANGNMTEQEYISLYNSMLSSIYTNQGFYIAAYEMGTGLATDAEVASNLTRTYQSSENNDPSSIQGMPKPISKANAVQYTYITQSQAQMLAQELKYPNITSSIMFGMQRDILSIFIEKFDTNNKATIKSEWISTNTFSKLWGNYLNSTFTLNRGFYTTSFNQGDNNVTKVTWNISSQNEKKESEQLIHTTGASDQNSSLNIYDLAGNLAEFTLEKYKNSSDPAAIFGGWSYEEDSANTRYMLIKPHFSATSRISLWK